MSIRTSSLRYPFALPGSERTDCTLGSVLARNDFDLTMTVLFSGDTQEGPPTCDKRRSVRGFKLHFAASLVWSEFLLLGGFLFSLWLCWAGSGPRRPCAPGAGGSIGSKGNDAAHLGE